MFLYRKQHKHTVCCHFILLTGLYSLLYLFFVLFSQCLVSCLAKPKKKRKYSPQCCTRLNTHFKFLLFKAAYYFFMKIDS